MATAPPEMSQCLDSVSIERRRLVLRCRPRTLYATWAVAIACLAIAAAVVYQRPAWQAKAYVRFKRIMMLSGFGESIGIGNLDREMILNRKGLNVPNDDLAGRKPVSMPMTPAAVMDYIGESFHRLFLSVDSDSDDYLNPVEFGRLLDRLQPVRNFLPDADHGPPALAEDGAGGGDRQVRLLCQFDPLHLDTITKDLTPESGTNVHYMESLLNWTRPHRCPLTLPERLLIEGLRPPDLRLGRPYYLTKRPVDLSLSGMWIMSEFDYETPHSLNRYFPPDYERPGARAVQALLSAFHGSAFASTRHPPHSSVALVRAVGADFVDVAFRLHGEFQLSRPPGYPFWFTPSFWFGHAVFSRDFSRLLSLDMDLPADKKLNVDMEWLQTGMAGAPDEQIVEVDIGYSASMRLCTDNVCDKRPATFGQYEAQQPGPAEQQMSFDRAFAQLEVELYPFKRVPYLPFPDAFRQAKKDGRLVHSVVLWGSLDDQSC